MKEKKHTKEEILELLNCKLIVKSKWVYALIDREYEEEWIKFCCSGILLLKQDYCIQKKDMKLVIELMNILEEEEEEK